MAKPQKEPYTPIGNETLERIMKTNLNGTQLRIVMAIWRYTYGFQRKTSDFSINFLANALDANRSQINRETTRLIERNILSVVGSGTRNKRIIEFNKNYSEWTSYIPTKKETTKKIAAPPPVSKKKAKKNYEEDNTYFRMAKYLYDKIKLVAEAESKGHLIINADLQKWADDMRKLVEVDKQNKQLAKDVMDWVPTSSFWKTNILSAKKFRAQFIKLVLDMSKDNKPKQQQRQPDARDKDLEFQKHLDAGGKEDEFDWS
jgi:phage replication O-like protein O